MLTQIKQSFLSYWVRGNLKICQQINAAEQLALLAFRKEIVTIVSITGNSFSLTTVSQRTKAIYLFRFCNVIKIKSHICTVV